MIRNEMKGYSSVVLYDGEEKDFSEIEFNFICETCGNKANVKLVDGVKISDIKDEALKTDILNRTKLNTKDIAGIIFYKTRENLNPLAKFLSCESCKERYLLIVGMGEVQPARYKIVISKIFRLDPN